MNAPRTPGRPGAPQGRAPDDGEALGRLARGEVDALGEVYDRHYAAVYRFLCRTTLDAVDAEDLAQTTFLTAARHAAAFDGRESCRPWLFGIAASLARRRRRTASRLARLLDGLLSARTMLTMPREPDADLDARRRVSALDQALGSLSEGKRMVILLAEVEGLTGEQIAAALGIPVNTVWTRLHHARRQLREMLIEGGE